MTILWNYYIILYILYNIIILYFYIKNKSSKSSKLVETGNKLYVLVVNLVPSSFVFSL